MHAGIAVLEQVLELAEQYVFAQLDKLLGEKCNLTLSCGAYTVSEVYPLEVVRERRVSRCTIHVDVQHRPTYLRGVDSTEGLSEESRSFAGDVPMTRRDWRWSLLG
ncbi:hypothetical protein MRX96_019596 [Rhipicephalus microplus]